MTIARQTRWSQDRKASGLCVSCGKPRNFYASLCTTCAVRQRARMRMYRRSRQLPIVSSPERNWSQFVKSEHRQPKQNKQLQTQCPITSNRKWSQKSLFCSEIRTGNSPHLLRSIVDGNSSGASLQSTPLPHDSNDTFSPSLQVVHGDVGNAYSKRVMARLSRMEDREVLVSFRDDYRIAWLTVLHASEGMLNAWEYSFWQYLGKHPDKLIPEFVKRDDRHQMMEIPDYDPLADRRKA